ncbi:DNA internalization-related competence protein ComEC/Rec2 [Vibrio aestuarianus]|nr:DNA internalization-related competence protein ComEC/Rec2 [Vibrio aestuarianus]MDE1214539.1 DNA internalization-related competence protein ComEC/Rec2 [Vibrio aestuarianus]MDE1217277.1 DNA internalization-related competence protein ComEC/Rec2 [Vibrio aestuarianus]MDE1228058.1 DNA internalization-related competence protein ComEC/Rec2 [Vibrio aestuarianus]MDE1257018.1 DNA internalization-related competence protein ComEC/Rec2 [Vibrio aestuarianus]MDE1261583.1 DNA internalization-related compete
MTLISNYWTLASFSLTIISASYWPLMPDWKWAIPFILTFILSIGSKKLRLLSGISVALLVIFTNGNLLHEQSNTIFQAGPNIIINAEVDSLFRQISYGYEGTVSIRSMNGQVLSAFLQPKVRLVAPLPLMIGDKVQFSVMVKPVFGRLNEAGFDLESYYLSQGIVARASVIANTSYYVESLSGLRMEWYQQIRAWLENAPNQGILLALTFGERGDISASQWQALRDSGLIHLIAISGLHIGIAFGFGYSLGLFLMRLHSRMLWAPFVIGSLCALFYAWLAGFTIPTQRALVMCLLNVAIVAFNVRINTLQRLLITLSVVLFIDPFASLSSSFWMSFAAISVIFYQLSLPTKSRPLLLRLVVMQVGLIFCMSPVTAYFFGGVSVSAALYNLLFIPWFSFVVVPAIFVALFFTALGADFAATLWLWLSKLLVPVDWFTSFAGVSWITISSDTLTLLCALLVILIFSPLMSVFTRGISCLIVIAYWVSIPTPLTWKVDVLDVGHGLAVLIEKGGHYVLYDTGSSWQGGDHIQSTVSPILTKRGVDQLDGLILSHMDNDHAGGRTEVERVWQPSWKRASQSLLDYQRCVAGETWQWQQLNFAVVWPPNLAKRAYNPHSCVVRVFDQNTGFSVLLPGDVDAISEWLLARTSEDLHSTVMLVPHHGSRTSSIDALIKKVQPELVIASLAKGNRWQLPSPMVVERYRKNGAQWLDTGDAGQISITFIDEQYYVNSLRLSHSQPWYRQMLRNKVE